MAIRRSKQKQQVVQKLMEIAPPGEQFIAAVHCETGPSPWLGTLFDQVPFLATIVALMRTYHFLVVTNTSIVVFGANRFTNRPTQIIQAFPRNAFPATKIKRARVWSSMYMAMPPSGKNTRININRYWRSEFDQLIAALPPEQVQAISQG